MKKKFLIICIVFFSIVLFFIAFLFFFPEFTIYSSDTTTIIKKKGYIEVDTYTPDSNQGTDWQVAMALKDTYPTDVFVLGEDCHFIKELEFKQIYEISDSSLASEKRFKAIIINDMHGKLYITKEQCELLRHYIWDEKYSCCYIGGKNLSFMLETGELSDLLPDENAGIGMRCVMQLDSGVHCFSGPWDSEGQKYYDQGQTQLLGEVIITGVLKEIIDEAEND